MAKKSPNFNLSAWYTTEKTLLYDYLVRMTGDPIHMPTTMLEVVRVVQEKAKENQWNLEEVRLKLYQTARSFCADKWNVSSSEIMDQLYQGTNHHDSLREVEGFVEKLDGVVREALLLKYRYAFKDDEIGQILGKLSKKALPQLDQVLVDFKESFPKLELKALMQLPLFTIESEEHTTGALSQLLDMPAKGKKYRWLKSLFWLLAIGALVYFVLKQQV